MWPNPQETADLVKFTEETLNGKLHFLCSQVVGLRFSSSILAFTGKSDFQFPKF